jgi:hypothetical protein
MGQPDYQVSTPWTAGGGGIRLTVHDSGTFCAAPGRTETVQLSWSFSRDITNLGNGDTFVATALAAKVSVTGGCTGSLAALTAFNVGGIAGDGSMPLTTFDRPPDRQRFTGLTSDVSADPYQGRRSSESATLGVAGTPSDPKLPQAAFRVGFYAPGLQFYVLYRYEQV